MKLCIPTIGTKIVLESDWTFELHSEYRNSAFINKLIDTGLFKGKKVERYTFDGKSIGKVTIPKGALLTVSRIYIRQGKGDFDSITFNVNLKLSGKGPKSKLTGRFWAKLADVNNIEYTTNLEAVVQEVSVSIASEEFV